MSNSLSSFTPAQLRRAADLKEKIEALNQELVSILGNSASVSVKGKRRMSPAGRARVSAAQKARWAKIKAKPTSKSTKAATKALPKKRKMSVAGRKRIAAAAKARWAKVKAAGRKSL